MTSWLEGIIWANVQIALAAAAALIVSALISLLLGRRLPVWRKGLWLLCMLLPVIVVTAALLMPPERPWLLPGYWLSRAVPALRSPAGVAAATAAHRFVVVLFAVWIAASLLLELGTLVRLGQILRRSHPVTDPRVIELYCHLVRAMGCWSPPRLLSTAHVSAPFVVFRLWRGYELILPDVVTTPAVHERTLRAVLSHELAHARAGDPWVQRLCFLARCLLPIPWISGLGAARQFWEDAAEETGDLRALRASGLTAREYGGVVRDLAVPAAGDPPPHIGLAFPPLMNKLSPPTRRVAEQLLRRLGVLRLIGQWSEIRVMAVSACARGTLALIVLIGVIRYSALSDLLGDPRLPSPAVAAPTPASPSHHGNKVLDGALPPADAPVAVAESAATQLPTTQPDPDMSWISLSKLPPGIRKRLEPLPPGAPHREKKH